MSRSLETEAGVQAEPAGLCDYCGARLLPRHDQASRVGGKKYCCYGCRVLGEAGGQSLRLGKESASPWFKIAIGAVLAGQAMLLGLAVSLTPPQGTARWLLHGALVTSSLAAVILLGRPLMRGALEEIRARRVSVELLFLAGILGAFGASLHSTLRGDGPVFYEVVAVLLTVYSVGKTLGARSRARALQETRHLAETFDRCRRIESDGRETMVAVRAIRANDRIRVLPGEPIPVDGEILRGQAYVAETPLTGEPFPVVRRAGDRVLAGSYSEDGELEVRATAPGDSRQLDGLLRALDQARERPCRLQAQADAIVKWFLPLVLTLAVATFVFWTIRSGWSTGLFNGLAVLLVACPCAMGLATPVALWSGLASLAARGVVARGGDALERLALSQEVFLDKTGTLSEETYSLIDLVAEGSAEDRRRLRGMLAAVQRCVAHPVARAFDGLADAQSSTALPWRVRSVKTLPALGIEAWVEGYGAEHHLRAGQAALLSDLRGAPGLVERLRHEAGDPLIYVEVDGRLAGIAAVRERLRHSASEALRALKGLGLGCRVLTGDSAERATTLLQGWPIESRLTPEGKAERVRAAEASGRKVAFVGDGVNDALAMRESTAGIALAHGAGVTTTSADVLLYGGDLRLVPWAIGLARQVRSCIQANLVFAAAYNIAGMILAAAGLLHPVAAALLMVVSSFTVSWRALRSTDKAAACCIGEGSPFVARHEQLPGATQADGPQLVQGGARPLARPSSVAEKSDLGRRRLQMVWAVLIVTQVPFLIYFGQLNTAESLVVGALFAGLSVAAVRFRGEHPEWRRAALMTFAMMGPGNWGMILGWWADAGFSPTTGGCPQCAAAGFKILGFLDAPWMNLGMVVLGVPPMLWGGDGPRPGLSRWAFGILSAVGMVLGMSYGDYVFLRWIGPHVSNHFLVSLSGMVVGMLLGMFLFCEFGRALSLAFARRRQAAGPV